MGERGRLRAEEGALAGAWPQAQGREGRRVPRVYFQFILFESFFASSLFQWLTSGYYDLLFFGSSLRAYFVSSVNSAVENVVVRCVTTKWLRTFTTEAQSARRTHRGLYYSFTSSLQFGTYFSNMFF